MASASSNSVPVDELKDLLTCSFCLETLSEPKSLPCFHNFCKICLGKYVEGLRGSGKNIETFPCPTCRSEFTLKANQNIAGMASNYFIKNMLEIVAVQRQAKGSTASTICSRCEDLAINHCATCGVFMCEKCSESHDIWLTSHDVFSVQELSSNPEAQLKSRSQLHCTKHEDKALEYYCETCKELSCMHCMVLNHLKQNHSCVAVNEVAQKHREALQSTCSTLDEKISEGNEALNAICEVMKSLEKNAQTTKDQITEQMESILTFVAENLEKRKKEMNKEVDEAYDELYNELSKQHDEIKVYLDEVEGSVSLPSNLLKRGSIEEILSSQKAIDENIEKLRKEQPEDLAPVNDGGIKYVPEVIDELNVDSIVHALGYIDVGKETKDENSKETKSAEILKNAVNNPEFAPGRTFQQTVQKNPRTHGSFLASAVNAPEFVPGRAFVTPDKRLMTLQHFVSHKIQQLTEDPGLLDEISMSMVNYLSVFIQVENDMMKLSDILFEKSMSEQNVQYTASRLANHLDKKLVPKNIGRHCFKNAFLTRCSKENSQFQDIIHRNPKRAYNFAIFFGELLMNFKHKNGKTIAKFLTVVSNIIKQLLACSDRKLLICAGKLLKLTGSSLNQHDDLFQTVEKLASDPHADKKAQILFSRVCELRRTSWGQYEMPVYQNAPYPDTHKYSMYFPNMDAILEEQSSDLPVYPEEEWTEYTADSSPDEVATNETDEERIYREACSEQYEHYYPNAVNWSSDPPEDDYYDDYEEFLRGQPK